MKTQSPKGKKGTVLSTVSYRYSIIVSLSIFIILFHAVSFQSYRFINSWLPEIKNAVQSQEESGISIQIKLNADEISVSIQQSTLFFEIVRGYTELVFQGTLPVDHYYSSFHEDSVSISTDVSNQQHTEGFVDKENTVKSALVITESLEYSIWYHNDANAYNDESFPYVQNSSILDNIFRTAYGGSPAITTMFVGMSNGVFRVYPQDRLESRFLKPHRDQRSSDYACYLPNETSDWNRYEPRCRNFYKRAINNQNSVAYGQLRQVQDRVDTYTANVEETSLVNVLTLSKVLRDKAGGVIGVLAMDVKDTSIQQTVGLPLLKSGYQFVVLTSLYSTPSTRGVVYHRNCMLVNTGVENFCKLEDLEPALFAQTDLVDAIYNRTTGNSSFSDGPTKWFITYHPIATATATGEEGTEGLSIVGLVPYKDIDHEYLALKGRVKRFTKHSLVVSILVVIVMFLVMIKLSSFFFKALINPLQEFNNQAAANLNDNELEVKLGNSIRSTSFKFREMANVTSFFQSLIFILDDVNRQYFNNKFDVAYEQILLLEDIFHEMGNEPCVGVVLNNKGAILLKLFKIADHTIAAKDCFKEAIRIGHMVVGNFSKLSDQRKRTRTMFRFHTMTLAGRYCNLGNYYQMVRDFNAALAAYEMSVVLYTQAGDVVGKARATGNIGHTYLALKSRSNAKRVFLDSYQIAMEKFSKRPTNRARHLLQNASMNLGIFYRLDARFEHARPYFVYALELSRNISKAVLFRCYSELVYIYHQSTDPRSIAMAALLKKDNTYFEALTPRSIHFLLDKSSSMKKRFRDPVLSTLSCLSNDTGDGGSASGVNFSPGGMESSANFPGMAQKEKAAGNPSCLRFAKNCIKFIINSCLTGKDFVSLTTFDQKIKKDLVHSSVQDQKEVILEQVESSVTEDTCSGPCALFDALQNALLSAYTNKRVNNFDSWIVVFTTGKDSASIRTLEEMEAVMARVNVNFIFITLAPREVVRRVTGRKARQGLPSTQEDADEDEEKDEEKDDDEDDVGSEYEDYVEDDDDLLPDSPTTARDSTPSSAQTPPPLPLPLPSSCPPSFSSTNVHETLDEADVARKMSLFSKRRSTFTTKSDNVTPHDVSGSGEDVQQHPLDCLFEDTHQRKCFHLNSKVEGDDMIRFKLFNAFEDVEINVFDAILESVL